VHACRAPAENRCLARWVLMLSEFSPRTPSAVVVSPSISSFA
jgi:hypothetical protein